MTYDKTHTIDHCDKCQKLIGFKKLNKLPFLYCDKNDEVHIDVSYLVNLKIGEGYRQYYVCKKCLKK